MVEPLARPVRNRLRAVMLHVPWYAFEGQARLAADVGVSASTVSRLVNGKLNPSWRLIAAVTRAMSRRLGRPLCERDLFSTDGAWDESACELCDCEACFPPEAWDERRDVLRPGWRDAVPGEWSRPASSPMSSPMS